MTATHTRERLLAAPEVLGLDSRTAFRERAVALLDEMKEPGGRLVVDFQRTVRMDSSGLGVLMLVQRQAAERRHVVVLRNLSDEIRFLLVLTKLLDLFQLDGSGR